MKAASAAALLFALGNGLLLLALFLSAVWTFCCSQPLYFGAEVTRVLRSLPGQSKLHGGVLASGFM